MTDAPFVFAGYGITGVVLAVLVLRTLARGRRLSRQVPPKDRRWL